MLNKPGAGNEIKGKNKVGHVFHMDDVKLFSRDETKLQQELTIVKAFINDIQMDFGLEKCTTAVFKHGKVPQTHSTSLEKPDSNREHGG